MIKIMTVVLLFSASLLALDWAKDLDNALTIAKKEHKNIMVMVEGKYCSWCKKMKNRTFTDESIEKRLKKFIVVKVMREDSSAMAKLPSVDGVPTIFFMRASKAVIWEVLGYQNVTDFNTTLNDVAKK